MRERSSLLDLLKSILRAPFISWMPSNLPPKPALEVICDPSNISIWGT